MHTHSKPRHIVAHVALVAVAVLAALVATVHLPPIPAIRSLGALAAAHAALAVVVGVAFVVLRRAHRGEPPEVGVALRRARLYDWLSDLHGFGRGSPFRSRTLDVAGLAAGERVLDVGCGTGTLALAAKDLVGAGGSVHGVDASQEMIARATAKAVRSGARVVFEVAAAQSLPFPDATFDVVLCSLALHHLPERARGPAIAEMRRVLKPHGRALIVELSREGGRLRPLALLHALRNPRIVEVAERSMRDTGFVRIETGSLDSDGAVYLLARVPGEEASS